MTTGRAALACHQSHVHNPNKSLCRPQSSSASRVTAAASGFLNLSQSFVLPDRYCDPSRFDTMPSSPSLQAWHTAFPSVSLIKVLYCFHQNKADSKCEVVHTSHPDSVPTIRPSEFGLLAGGVACAGSSSTNIKSSIRKIKKRFVAGFGLIPLLERYC